MSKERSRSTGRFLKGHSGNPNGRPRKPQARKNGASISAFEVLSAKQYPVTQGGIELHLSVEQVLQRRLLEKALAGSKVARRAILKMIIEREKAKAKRNARITTSTTSRSECDVRNADAAMCLLGIAGPDLSETGDNCDALLLETWAALSRRRGRRALTSDEINTIQRCTREPQTLRLPRSVVR